MFQKLHSIILIPNFFIQYISIFASSSNITPPPPPKKKKKKKNCSCKSKLFPLKVPLLPRLHPPGKQTEVKIDVLLCQNDGKTRDVPICLKQFLCVSVFRGIRFLCPATKSGGVLCYTLRTFECLSVRLSVRPSVRQRLIIRVRSITLIPFKIISRNLAQM